jgi:membrane-bound lytic murein transglycosylase C
MWFRRLAVCLTAVVTVSLSASCATSKSVGANVKRAYNGQPVDRKELSQAMSSDTKDMEAHLAVLRRKLEAAYAQLRTNVQKRWGQSDTKVATRTVYVKYTQDYKSRVITDFDHGTLTIETVDETNPEGSLKATIAAALLTPGDPATVDLFSDKDVALEPDRKPYLYGLVHDNNGKSIQTRQQAVQYASYLVPQKMQKRATAKEQGGKTAVFVQILMVKNYEVKGADRYRASVDKYAAQYNVSPTLVLAIIRTESNFNPFAVSGAPAYGLMQLVPTSGGRAAIKRVQGIDQTPTADYLFDPDHNIELGTAYLSVLESAEFKAVNSPDSRDYCVIAAYNTGPRNVTRVFASDRNEAFNNINGLPPPALFDKLHSELPSDETRQYVVKVTGYRKQFVSQPAGSAAAASPARPAAAPGGTAVAAGAGAAPSVGTAATNRSGTATAGAASTAAGSGIATAGAATTRAGSGTATATAGSAASAGRAAASTRAMAPGRTPNGATANPTAAPANIAAGVTASPASAAPASTPAGRTTNPAAPVPTKPATGATAATQPNNHGS